MKMKKLPMKNECSITYPMTEDVKIAVRAAVELPAYLEDSYTQEGNLETRHFKVAQGHEFENNLAYESTVRLLSYKMREMDIPFSLVADNEEHLCKQEFRPDEFPREYVSIDNSASISAEELKQALQSKMSNQEIREKLAVYVDNLMPKTTIQQASEEYMAAPTNQYPSPSEVKETVVKNLQEMCKKAGLPYEVGYAPAIVDKNTMNPIGEHRIFFHNPEISETSPNGKQWEDLILDAKTWNLKRVKNEIEMRFRGSMETYDLDNSIHLQKNFKGLDKAVEKFISKDGKMLDEIPLKKPQKAEAKGMNDLKDAISTLMKKDGMSKEKVLKAVKDITKAITQEQGR